MKRQGNKRSFEIGAATGFLAYVIMAVSWMPAGASKLRMAAQVGFARIVVSEIEAPNILVDLMQRG